MKQVIYNIVPHCGIVRDIYLDLNKLYACSAQHYRPK
jgi:hypothetical protein